MRTGSLSLKKKKVFKCDSKYVLIEGQIIKALLKYNHMFVPDKFINTLRNFLMERHQDIKLYILTSGAGAKKDSYSYSLIFHF